MDPEQKRFAPFFLLMSEKYEAVSMPELRSNLVKIRAHISELVPSVAKYRQDHVHAKTAYKQALAKAKIKALQEATTKAEQSPTMINAVAEIDKTVVEAQKKLDIAECFVTAADLQMDALEEQCKAIKKAMGTLEAELRTFGS